MSTATLIGAAELAAHLQDPDWVVLDCRHDLGDPQTGRRAWEAGHIPTAQYVDIETELSDKSPGPNGEFRGRHPLPSPEAFIATLRRWGVNPQSQVVAYDAQGGMFAARLWWMLRWVGHEAVAVLDGGLAAWTASGKPLSTDAGTRPAGTITIRPSLARTVNASELLAASSLTIIDARAPDRFRGENETLDPVGGHIPGARNRFFKDNLDAAGRFRPASELRAEFSALLGTPALTVMQCGSGVTACHNLLAMEVAGLAGAALYPGSWSEWCADPQRPVATGAA
ncbi:sulfurtransferase [Lacisediminimonas profundi]|uniref:sulfurtransferase n=1 Tax=Lacisediminimonas profundi TaxID=2603856 RepID=UPI00124B1646|nr:sulfurtransferase [Lacisediminimonas profundi]